MSLLVAPVQAEVDATIDRLSDESRRLWERLRDKG